MVYCEMKMLNEEWMTCFNFDQCLFVVSTQFTYTSLNRNM